METDERDKEIAMAIVDLDSAIRAFNEKMSRFQLRGYMVRRPYSEYIRKRISRFVIKLHEKLDEIQRALEP